MVRREIQQDIGDEMKGCHSSEVFDAGYAVPLYDILNCTHIFRYRGETRTVRWLSVPMSEYKGWPVAKWESVLKQEEIK